VSRPALYVETTVVSYLTAYPSRDLLTAGHQLVTREWWEASRARFDLFTSLVVLNEATKGDAEMVRRRLDVLSGLSVLPLTDAATELAAALLRRGPLPKKAEADALHIALSAVHRMDYLLTWNCKHIANAAMRGRIEAICLGAGYRAPTMCTPEEL
jgi:hypothetical protein